VEEKALLLSHFFEGKPLVQEYVNGALLGIEYLWGGQVFLDTTEVVPKGPGPKQEKSDGQEQPVEEITWQKVRYRMKDRKLSRKILNE
jgi:stage V sporulation protein R